VELTWNVVGEVDVVEVVDEGDVVEVGRPIEGTDIF
jgi:hypothetical protein